MKFFKQLSWSRLGRSIDRAVTELYFAAGIILAVYGVWMISKPAAFIVSGVVLAVLAILKSYAGRD